MKIVQVRTAAALGALAAMLTLAACGGDKSGTDTSAGVGASATAATPGGGAQPAAGGSVHTVEMLTDPADGTNKFVPAELTVKQGDVIRYVLKMGVHNVSFLPDSNPGKSGLPAPSPMLQAPGQTHDVAVTFGAGTYYFQCDPHAALGMKGHLTVQ
jgi:plastocyanin